MNPPKTFSAILAGSNRQNKSAQPAWVKRLTQAQAERNCI